MSVSVEQVAVPDRRITRLEVELYKREILEQSVLVSPQEARMILACSETKVYRLVQTGRLKGYSENRKSKGLRLLASELRDYVRSIKVDSDEWRE
jgi:hypothetical protein